MHTKARDHKRWKLADKMRESDSFKIKQLGDSIFPVNPEWERKEVESMESILRDKYEQCPTYKKALDSKES